MEIMANLLIFQFLQYSAIIVKMFRMKAQVASQAFVDANTISMKKQIRLALQFAAISLIFFAAAVVYIPKSDSLVHGMAERMTQMLVAAVDIPLLCLANRKIRADMWAMIRKSIKLD